MTNTELLNVAKRLYKQVLEMAFGLTYMGEMSSERAAIIRELQPYAKQVIAAAEKAQPDTTIHQMD